jgi:hypothetical protein
MDSSIDSSNTSDSSLTHPPPPTLNKDIVNHTEINLEIIENVVDVVKEPFNKGDYSGEWDGENNRPHGKGRLEKIGGYNRYIYDGNWINGLLNGPVTVTKTYPGSISAEKYVAFYENGQEKRIDKFYTGYNNWFEGTKIQRLGGNLVKNGNGRIINDYGTILEMGYWFNDDKVYREFSTLGINSESPFDYKDGKWKDGINPGNLKYFTRIAGTRKNINNKHKKKYSKKNKKHRKFTKCKNKKCKRKNIKKSTKNKGFIKH